MEFLKKYTSHEEYEVDKTPNVSLCVENNEKHLHYTKKKFDDEYLTFEALESGTFTLTIYSGVTTGDVVSVSYSLDNGETWTTTNNIQGQRVVITTPTVNAGDEVLWKGNAVRMANNSNTVSASTFSSTANFNARGNVMSLLYGDEFKDKVDLNGKDYCFCYLFNNNIKLINGKNISLTATTLARSCYYYMFYGCTSLTTSPELPATTLANFCYGYMFYGCTSLTTSPELPATTLADSCYSSMFRNCTSLTVASELPATILATWCYSHMFNNCTSLTTAPELPATTLRSYCYHFMFSDCESLTTAPELPATTLAGSCYERMFNGCTSLTVAPELPATTLANLCYWCMFSDCTSLTVAPKLSAITLAGRCCGSMFDGCTSLTVAPKLFATTLAVSACTFMFNGCTSLTTAPELPATTLADYCYYGMFNNCTSLTTAPELPATTLAERCYSYMFYGCTSLTVASELPATKLLTGCYSNMFSRCTNLTTAPELHATTLTLYCYFNMFYGCTNLNSITCLATNISATDCTKNWVNGVAASGTFIKDSSMTGWSRGNNGIPTNWTVQDYDYSKDYLTFDILSAGTINWRTRSTATTVATISYSLNGGEWTDITSSTAGTSFNVSKGDNVKFKGNNITYGTSSINYNTFSGSTASFNVKGNIMSLISGDSFANVTALESGYTFNGLFQNTKVKETLNLVMPATTLTAYCYDSMFYGCTSLTTAPKLPATILTFACYGNMFESCASLTVAPELQATTLAPNCYHEMFWRCTSLTTAPELPATTLTTYCYYRMFMGCTGLTAAPELPATELTQGCYNEMFQGCTSLTVAPELPATTLAYECYRDMFWACTNLTTAPELPAITLATWCYNGMFKGCTRLTTAPELPATTLALQCYEDMFRDCTGLTTAPELPATALTRYCYTEMFLGCTSLTVAPELPATTLEYGCYWNMFSGCVNLTIAPKLPATTLMDYCYYNMFSGCTRLNSITCLATDISASNCTTNWVSGVASSGTFTKAASMSSWTRGVNGIPTNWTVKDYYGDEYLTFDILSAGTINWKATSTSTTVTTISYSINNGAWTDIASSTAGTSFNVSDGDKVRFKGNNAGYSTTLRDFNTFMGSTASFNLEGNIMSLIDDTIFDYKTTLDTDLTFNYLFWNTNVNNAENLILPATTLASGCYSYMFNGCTSLTTAPELPATTLANNCYSSMFRGCTSLTTAPELSVTTLANGCYGGMFNGCTSLTTAPELPATSLTYQCYIDMFEGCTSLTTAPELPATTLANECYTSMFNSCTSLTVAPELPATTLANSCYWYMFSKCTSLTTAPELSATSLTYRCYYGMFSGCTSLNSITCLATDISATSCTSNWVSGVASSGTFIKANGMNDWTRGSDGIPTNWNVEDYNTHDGALMTMYVDDFKEFDFIDDQVDDPESYGCNLYMYRGTLTRSGHTYYSWILDGVTDQPYVYLLTTTNDYNTLYNQSLEENKSNTFTSFVERCSSDAPPITYESNYDRYLYLVKMYRNGNQIGMWVDDYKFGPALVAEEINDPIGYELDTYKYYGDTITRNGTTYYVWEMSEECSWNSGISNLLTTTVNFNTLYGQSLEDDYYNTFTSLVGRFDEDIEDEYVDSEGNQLYLVKVIEGSSATMRIWVDDFPLSVQQDYDDEHQRLLNMTVNDPDNYSNKYVYTNTTVQMNGNTYHVWEYDLDTDTPYSYLLTTTADVNTLYSQSLDDDLTNQFTAYVGRCSSDLDEIYADDSVVGKMYLVNAITENGTPVIYVDDFADTIKEYSLGWLDNEANPYDFKGNTITYNGNTYYLWEMNTELGAPSQENVPYFATTTVDFDTLYSQSIEDDVDNRFTSAVGMFDDSEEIYTEQDILQDGTDRYYLLKVQRL